MVATKYDEQVMGTIDFQISYDKDKIPTKSIVQLIQRIINDLNTENEPMCNDHFDIHFRLDNIENQVWYKLNGLIHTAYERRNKKLTPAQVIDNYLTKDELKQFTDLTLQISKEAFRE
ncbi:MAG: hypothetical protein ACW99R_17970 [Candidatus Hodarchaeales archaeon]|jgi:hypothetical protein